MMVMSKSKMVLATILASSSLTMTSTVLAHAETSVGSKTTSSVNAPNVANSTSTDTTDTTDATNVSDTVSTTINFVRSDTGKQVGSITKSGKPNTSVDTAFYGTDNELPHGYAMDWDATNIAPTDTVELGDKDTTLTYKVKPVGMLYEIIYQDPDGNQVGYDRGMGYYDTPNSYDASNSLPDGYRVASVTVVGDSKATIVPGSDNKKLIFTPITSLSDDLSQYTRFIVHITTAPWAEHTATINYVDQSGKTVATDSVKDTENHSQTYDATAKLPSGYTLADEQEKSVDLTFTEDSTTTIKVKSDKVTPSEPSTPTVPTVPTTPNEPTTKPTTKPNDKVTITKSGQHKAVIAMKKLTLQLGDLGKSGKMVTYKNGKNIQHKAMFVIEKTATYKGHKYYYVRDVNSIYVNSNTKTNGLKGWVRADSGLFTSAYHKSNKPTTKKPLYVKVINHSGLNKYGKINLTGKKGHVRYGTRLKIVGQKGHNLTTRYKLSDGRWVSANRKLVRIIK